MTINGDFQLETPKRSNGKRSRLCANNSNSKLRKVETISSSVSGSSKLFRLKERKGITVEANIIDVNSPLSACICNSPYNFRSNVREAEMNEYLSPRDFRSKAEKDIIAEASILEYLSPKAFSPMVRKHSKGEASILEHFSPKVFHSAKDDKVFESPKKFRSKIRQCFPSQLSVVIEKNLCGFPDNFNSKVTNNISHEAMVINECDYPLDNQTFSTCVFTFYI